MKKEKVLLGLFAEIVVYMNLEPMIEHWIEEEGVDLTLDEFKQFLINKGAK
tara:strand:- start:399 stop:551 length:153 start_codon:yes stop_codon:yes gene_type:complete